MLWVLIRSASVTCFFQERRKIQFSGKKILVGQVDFDRLNKQVIKFDNSKPCFISCLLCQKFAFYALVSQNTYM